MHHHDSLRAGYLGDLAGAVVALDALLQGGSQWRRAGRRRRRRAGRQALCEHRGGAERRGRLGLDGRRLGADAEVLALFFPQCRCRASGAGRRRRCGAAVAGALACHLCRQIGAVTLGCGCLGAGQLLLWWRCRSVAVEREARGEADEASSRPCVLGGGLVGKGVGGGGAS